MTEKRFTVPIKYRFSHSKIQLNREPLTNDELVRILNTNDGAFVENFALKEENEQLKQTIKEVTELLEEEVDLFSDKATEHDINAYVELKELDNKDAYYMATATKKAIKILKGCLND